MSGRFPGASDLAAFWRNLRDGVESISSFSEPELLAAGVAPERFRNPHYVARAAVLTGIEQFDAEFFRFTPREAECADPQQRLLLECAWEALEQAGYAVPGCDARVGVYIGAGQSGYWLKHLARNPAVEANVGAIQLLIGNVSDYFATRISYKLNLTGPSLTVGTACSTSLVAVHLACQSLLDFNSDIALAGGASVQIPVCDGYLYEQGGIFSADGHCRPFDARAGGTLTGSGVGIVALRRLEDAIEARDTIHAVILGSAVNNDGSDKVGFTAPSQLGQAAVIADALAAADVSPDSISYVEGHGTATAIGDPIEVAALTSVFRQNTARRGFCGLGSVKGNLGHLDEAAGVTGLIKTVLALRERTLPPSLHFETPNPRLELDSSPFFVPTRAQPWTADGPRRAGVSSFGIGGTNAHVILQEAPAPSSPAPSRPTSLLLLSARTSDGLEAMRHNLAQHLETHPDLGLADVSYTLAVGRRAFSCRCAAACSTREEAIAWLRAPAPKTVGSTELRTRRPIFLFPGQGSQSAFMGAELYEAEPVFRATIDACAAILHDRCGFDLPAALRLADGRVDDTQFAQPALFATDYALAALLQSWGIEPEAMIGHSLGEYVAAARAGVFSLSDALALVAARGRLMQASPRGTMIAVAAGLAELRPSLHPGVALAAANGPASTVLSGPLDAIARTEAELAALGIHAIRLRTSHAFHSATMDEVLAPFGELLRNTALHPPKTRFISNVTGDWITAAQATDPGYWLRHLRNTVRFGEGIARLFELPDSVWIELGPGRTLASLIERHPDRPPDLEVLPTLPSDRSKRPKIPHLLSTLGELWRRGVTVGWQNFFQSERRRRVPLPTYPFERRRYWIEPPRSPTEHRPTLPAPASAAGPPIDSWFYAPRWSPVTPLPPAPLAGEAWLLLADDSPLAAAVAPRLRGLGALVEVVRDSEAVRQSPPGAHLLFFAMPQARSQPLADLLALVQALGASPLGRRFIVLTEETQAVRGGDAVSAPACGMLWGAVRTVATEYPNLRCCCIDLEARPPADAADDVLACLGHTGASLATRDGMVWEQHVEPIQLPATRPAKLRQGGAYLITGGLGSMGLAFAEYLARTGRAKIALVCRTGSDGAHSPPVVDPEASFPREAAARGESDAGLITAQAAYRSGRAQRIRSRIASMEAAGGEVCVIVADVSRPEDMARAVRTAEARFGPLDGAIHTAGVLGQTPIHYETPAGMQTVLAPKVDGALNLVAALSHRSLDFLMFCSSLSALTPIAGQFSYSAANAFLNSLALQQAARSPGLTVAIDWGFWQELGMMETAHTPAAVLQAVRDEISERGWTGKGVEIFDRVLRSEAPAELLVSPSRLTVEVAAVMDHPALRECLRQSRQRTLFSGSANAEDSWWVHEHRVGDLTVMPGAAYLDMAVAAFWHHRGKCATTLSDVCFLQPMIFRAAETRAIRLVLDEYADGFEFRICSEIAPDRWELHATGGIRASAAAARPARLDLAELGGKIGDRREPDGFRDRVNNFAPHWRNLREAKFSGEEGLARLTLADDLRQDASRFALHPALLDTATGFMAYSGEFDAFIPFSFATVQVFDRLPPVCIAHFRVLPGGSPSTAIFAGSVTDAAGHEVVRVEDYRLRRTDRRGSAPPPENVCLQLREIGDLQTLFYQPAARIPPAADEVEIEVRAAGLNFVEVLYSLGMMPNFTSGRITLGQECSGVVARVGAGIDHLKPGDEVIAYGPRCVALYATLSAGAVARKPRTLSFEEAAGLPAAFITAWYSLIELARLRPRERVLIHAAAGGVGLAAVRIAQWRGAEIFATAGSPEKRQFLAELQVTHVLDSRSLMFADEIRRITDGQGIDVVLNSLSGEFITASLALLRRHGRFLELGKRDILRNMPCGLGAFANYIAFFAVDIGSDVPGFAQMWDELSALLQNGELAAIPCRVFPASEATAAFEYMAQARQIGKVVLSMADGEGLRTLAGARESGQAWDKLVIPQADRTRSTDATVSPAPSQAPSATISPVVQHKRPSLTVEFRAPTTPTQQSIALIWEGLLGLAPIGVDDDFFELRGDSLLATQVMSRVQREFNVKLPLSIIFEHPTIHTLAEQVDANRLPAGAMDERADGYEYGVI